MLATIVVIVPEHEGRGSPAQFGKTPNSQLSTSFMPLPKQTFRYRPKGVSLFPRSFFVWPILAHDGERSWDTQFTIPVSPNACLGMRVVRLLRNEL